MEQDEGASVLQLQPVVWQLGQEGRGTAGVQQGVVVSGAARRE